MQLHTKLGYFGLSSFKRTVCPALLENNCDDCAMTNSTNASACQAAPMHEPNSPV